MRRVDLGMVPYQQAVTDMAGWVAQRREGTAGDRLFLLSHPPVITYGRRTDPADLPAATSGIPTVEVDRGGFATYHGPGQLVGYLMVNLRDRGPVDVVRLVENGLIAGRWPSSGSTRSDATPRRTRRAWPGCGHRIIASWPRSACASVAG